jgi:DNA-binding HxlR family transcriptional regulator
MAALDLLGRRWALRVIWELRGGPLGFRPLQQRCDNMSSSVLRVRLAELEAAALIERSDEGGYALTTVGHQLQNAIRPLTNWANSWAEIVAEPIPVDAGTGSGAPGERKPASERAGRPSKAR